MNYKKQTNHSHSTNSLKPTISNLSKAIFIINKHAKTATNPSFLYLIKKTAIEKLLQEGKAKKCGLHFSPNPKFSLQKSDVLISIGDYYFHLPPTKEDFKSLPHFGNLNQSYRNPKTKMALKEAKDLLITYTGISPDDNNQRAHKQTKKYQKPEFKKLGESYF